MEAPTCPICFADVIEWNSVVFRCKHEMHDACFFDFRVAGYVRCPLCRLHIIPPTKCQRELKSGRYCKSAPVIGKEFCSNHVPRAKSK